MGHNTPTLYRAATAVRRWPVAVVAVAGLLLVSYGGGIVAAPVTLPLLYLAVRQDQTGRRLKAAIVVVAALTAAEAGWAAAYLAVGEARPWIWLLPLAAGAGIGVAYGTAKPAAQPGSPPPFGPSAKQAGE